MKLIYYAIWASFFILFFSLKGIALPNADSVKNTQLWNLQDADILSIINEVSQETGKNFVVDPRVSGKITLVSSKPIKPSEVYQVFLSILELLGYSAIPTGNVVKIVPNMESGEFATHVASSKIPGKGDEVVVRVIPLDNVSANQLIPVIRPMLPQWSNISAYIPGNILILLGRAANLERISNVIRNIDDASTNQIDIVPLKQASASQLAIVLGNLQNSARAQGDMPQVSVAADDHTNSLLLSGNKSARLHMKYLISQLDEPSAGKQGNTEVIYLRYLQSKTLAPILGKIAQNMLGKADANASQISSNLNRNKPLENFTNIQSEPNTNAIIITASPTILAALKSIVAKLDIRPAQVLVEAIIVEIDESDLKNLGIQWGSLQSSTDASGNTSDAMVPGTFGIIPNTQIRAVLQALQNKSGVDVLSTPAIVVLNNGKGLLTVGKEVSVSTGSYATSANTTTVNPFNTIGRREVALTLQVTPQINLGNAVRLFLDLKNDTLQNSDDTSLTPIINTSKIKNSVIINSDDILVLGGLISNNHTQNTVKVPLLGDVPLVGNLFKYTSRKLEKKNLMVFIKPTILHDGVDAERISQIKYAKIRKTQIGWPQELAKTKEDHHANILPLWKNDAHIPTPFANDE